MSEHTEKSSPTEIDRHAMVANTRLIQEAMDRGRDSRGCVVAIPPGDFWVRTLTIPSFTELHLTSGSRLVAWPVAEDYEAASQGSTVPKDHHGGISALSLIQSSNSDKVSLTGMGTIDGNGFAFWDPPVRRVGTGSRELEPWREDDSPFWHAKTRRIIPLIEFSDCRDLCVRDVTITDSPGWTLHPFRCDRVKITGITIRNHLYGPNTDGIDINGCRDVVISGCSLVCGDDAIIIKTTERARSCERIVVSDCIVETNCAAFGIGAEVEFPIRDITVSGLSVRHALRMIQIELWTPGLVENVVITNVSGATMTDIPLERPMYVDIQHHGRSDGCLGSVRNLQIRGLSAITRGRCLFTAADGASIERLQLNGVQLTYPEIEDPEISVPSSRSNQMSNDSPETRAARSAFVFDNVHDALIDGVQIQWPTAASADPAGAIRGRYDWGELESDRRKQAALVEQPPMSAFLFRRSSRISVEAPFVHGNRAPLCDVRPGSENVIVNGVLVSDREDG